MSAYVSSTAGGLSSQVGHNPTSGRRARHRAQRRNEVYVAAVELFTHQGFDATTMGEIANRADVSRATVFNHFPRKTAFIDEWAARRRERAAVAVREANIVGMPLDQILERYMLEMARQSEEARRETVALVRAAAHGTGAASHSDLAGELAHFIVGAQQSGEARTSVDPRQAAVLAAASHSAVLAQWISEEPASFDLGAELLAMLDIVLYGIMERGRGEARNRENQKGRFGQAEAVPVGRRLQSARGCSLRQ